MPEHPFEPQAPAHGRGRWAIAWVLGVAALLRFAYWRELAPSPEVAAPALDAAFHDHWARALVTGDWSPPVHFPDPQIHTTPYFRPPGYPYFLAALYALTGCRPLAAIALQMLLGLCNCWLLFRIGRNLIGPRGALLAAAGLGCTWTSIYFEGELLAPVLLVHLLLWLLWAVQRWSATGSTRGALGTGALLGLLALCLPNALLLWPVLALWAIWWARRPNQPRPPAPGTGRRFALASAAGLALVIAPATLRNHATAGDWVLISSNGGVNLYIGNHPHADGHSASIPILGDLTGLSGWTCFDQPALVRGVERLVGRPLRASEVSAFFSGKAWDHLTSAPLASAGLWLRKAALFWGPLEVANNRELELVRADSAVLAWLPGFPIVWPLALLGALVLLRPRTPARGHPLLWLAAALALALFASYLPFFVAGRYRAPLLPILWLFASEGLRHLLALRRAPHRGPALAWLGAALGLLALAHVRTTAYQPNPGRYHFQTGDAHRRLGDHDAAIAAFRRAIAQAPDSAEAHNSLGALLLQRGEANGALASLQRAVQASPQFAEARFNLGKALAASGQLEAAVATFAALADHDQAGPAARLQLGALLLQLQRPAEAAPHLERAARDRPADPAPAYLHAMALLDLGQTSAARARLTALVALHPTHADAHVVLAELLFAAGDRAGAAAQLQKALAIAPRHPGALALRERLR